VRVSGYNSVKGQSRSLILIRSPCATSY